LIIQGGLNPFKHLNDVYMKRRLS